MMRKVQEQSKMVSASGERVNVLAAKRVEPEVGA